MKVLFMSGQPAARGVAGDRTAGADSELVDQPLTAQRLLPRIRQLIRRS
jgi:hypothetical protein